MEISAQQFEDHTRQDEERFNKIDEKIDNLPTKKDLDALSEEIKKHMEIVRPFLQGAAGFGVLWKILMAIGGLLVIWVQIKGIFGFK